MGQTPNGGEGGDTAGGRSGRGGRGRGRGGRNRGKAGESADGGEAGGGRGDATAPAATAASSPPSSATALRATSAAFIPRSVTVPNRPRAVPPAPTPAPTAKGGASNKQKKATRPKKSGVADRADVSPVDPPADPPPDAVPKNKHKNKASAKRSTKGTGGRPDNWWKTITQCGKFILINSYRTGNQTDAVFSFNRSNHAGAPRGLGPPAVRTTNTHEPQLAHRVAPLRPNLPRGVGDGEQTVRKPTQQNPDGRRRLPPTR